MKIATQKMYDYAQAIADKLGMYFKGYEYDAVSRAKAKAQICKYTCKINRIVLVEFVNSYNGKVYAFKVSPLFDHTNIVKGAYLVVDSPNGIALVRATTDIELATDGVLTAMGATLPLKSIKDIYLPKKHV